MPDTPSITPPTSSSPTPSTPPRNPQSRSKNIIIALSIVLGVILLGAIGAAAYFVGKQSSDGATPSPTPTPTPSSTPISATPTITPTPSDTSVIPRGAIDWQTPEILGDLGLTSQEDYLGKASAGPESDVLLYSSSGVKYVKVGTVQSGAYKDAELLVVSSTLSADFPSPWLPDFFYAMKQGDKFTFLTATFSGDEQKKDYDRIEVIGKRFSKSKTATVAFDVTTTIAELSFPDTIQGPNSRQVLVRDPYIHTFFDSSKMRKIFVDPTYGQVWTTDESKIDPEHPTANLLNSYYIDENGTIDYFDRTESSGFYVQAPDGTQITYQLKLDVFENDNAYSLLKATWDPNTVNAEDYEQVPSGCGSQAYVYNKTLDVNLSKEAERIGVTSRGDILYGYKDTTSAELQRLYNDVYWTNDGVAKKSIDEYRKLRPVVFFRDPFDRTLAFYRADLISPAECGKPVIYLYPEHATNVSVKVEPNRGLSISEPDYRNGWYVHTDEHSNITNLADGMSYPYLYWEGSSDLQYATPKQGFVLSGSRLQQQLSDKLVQLGLNDQEIRDFTEYWVPKMLSEQQPYYFVTFLSKQSIDALAPLTIEPKPDTVIRVLMDYYGLDHPIEVQEPHITTPERRGFTVVEWGGMLK